MKNKQNKAKKTPKPKKDPTNKNHNRSENTVSKSCPISLSDTGNSISRVQRKKKRSIMIMGHQICGGVPILSNFIYKICLSDKSRHIKAYKHMINPSSAVLNFSGSCLLPSSMMRQENCTLNLEFSEVVYQTEKVLVKIFSLKSLAFDAQKVFM